MTLIVGIRCSDGIVLAADGAATLGSMGNHTVQQKTVKKLTILQKKIVVGVAGAVGLSQRMSALIEDEYNAGKYKHIRAEKAMGVMRTALWERVVGPEWNCAKQTAPVLGAHIASSPANSAMVVALPLMGLAELIQFDQQSAPEMATPDLPFVAIGSGQSIADPFLAFIRRIFWPNGCPSLSDATFSAVWTLVHAIETNPGGVAEPIQIVVLEHEKKEHEKKEHEKKEHEKRDEWAARELTEGEIAQHREAVAAAEGSLKGWRSQLSTAPTERAPESPPP